MDTVILEETRNSALPSAVFVGDFNTGKSYVINALARQDLLFTGREESLAPPVLLARGEGVEPGYGGWDREEQSPVHKSHGQFLSSRKMDGQPCDSDALAVSTPGLPFAHVVLVDTPGASSQENRSATLAPAPVFDNTLFVITTTLEYWPARHTLSLIKEYHARFPGRFLVLANMADLANADEIRRVRGKAHHRMEQHGIRPAPPFFAVSARLELARRCENDEYRRRVKPEVRELCDAGFDAFRVALYEFEATVSRETSTGNWERLLNSDLAAALSTIQKGQNS